MLEQVPWLVRHGQAVWWAILVAFVAFGLAVTWALPRLSARRAARAARRTLEPVLETLEPARAGARVILRGVLAGEAERIDDVSRGVAVRVGESTVEIDGALRIAIASREVRAHVWRRPASDAPRELRRGDAVRASGVLQPALRVDADAGYRGEKPSFRLVPDGADDAVILAYEGAPRVEGPRRGAYPWGAALAAILFAALGWTTGAIATSIAWDFSNTAPLSKRTRAGAIAAATPFHRDRGISALYYALSHDDTSVREEAALEVYMSGDCEAALSRMRRVSFPRDIAEVGEACGGSASRRVAASARFELGELDRASALVATTSPKAGDVGDAWLDGMLHLTAGHLALAATAFRAHAAASPGLYDAGPPREHHIATLECLADALDARAGNAQALASLERRVTGIAAARCGLLLADLRTGAERLAVLDRIEKGDYKVDEVREELAIEVDPARAEKKYLAFSFPVWIVAGYEPFANSRVGLRRGALAKLEALADPSPAQRSARAGFAIEAAKTASLGGAPADARRWIAEAEADILVLQRATNDLIAPNAASVAVLFRAAIEIRAGDLAAARTALARVPSGHDQGSEEWRLELTGIVDFMTRGETAWLDAPRMFGTLGTRDYPERAKGLRLAAAGDGAELAAWLKTSIGAYAMPVALVGASRVREGKGALLDWLRRMHSDECYTMRYCSLEEVAADAENRAILAEAFGDHELSSGYARTAAVFHETTNRRDLAVPLALLRSL